MIDPAAGERGHEATLDRLQPGEAGRVVRILAPDLVMRRLMELGLTPGIRVEVVRRAPLGDPIELRLRETHLSIRGTEAAQVHVELD